MEAHGKNAIIFDIQRGSYVDGPGIRTTVFLKGCNLSCAWCHNPESQSGNAELMWYDNKCRSCGKCGTVCKNGAIRRDTVSGRISFKKMECDLCGKCALYCPTDAISICGRCADADEIFSEVRKDRPFYETSGGGVTVSGGECMLQPDFVAELFGKCRDDGINTAMDTAGNVRWESFEKVIPYTDIFLYDIKCITPQMHRKFIGADNALILENYKRLIKKGCRVIVRVPMIVECSANDEEFAKISHFLHKNRPEKAELLPYHTMGVNKYSALGRGQQKVFTAPDSTALERYRDMVSDINSK